VAVIECPPAGGVRRRVGHQCGTRRRGGIAALVDQVGGGLEDGFLGQGELGVATAGQFGRDPDTVHLGSGRLDREQALRSLDHHDREDHAEDQEVVVDQVEVGQQLDAGRVAERVDRRVHELGRPGQEGQVHVLHGECPDDHAAQRADAAEDDHDHDEDRGLEAEALREDGGVVGAREGAGEPREAGAQGERQELRRDRVDAHRGGRRLVLPDGHPRSTELRVAQAHADEEGQAQQGHDEVQRERRLLVGEDDLGPPWARYGQRRRVDRVDADVAAGQVGIRADEDRAAEDGGQGEGEVAQVAEDDGHDLAEAQGHDGEVVATQLERGGAEQDAEHGGGTDGHPDHDPPADVDAEVGRGQEGRRVRADGVERHVAQVEQAGEAHHDVQAEGEDAERGAHDEHRGVRPRHEAQVGLQEAEQQRVDHDQDEQGRDDDHVAAIAVHAGEGVAGRSGGGGSSHVRRAPMPSRRAAPSAGRRGRG
jgi:hypothetical protein